MLSRFIISFHFYGALLVWPCAAAVAQTAEEQPRVSVSAGLVSDYRFRGESLSDGGPALQAGIDVSRSGWSLGAWTSTTRNAGTRGEELDLYAGRSGDVGGLHYAVTGYAYLFQGQPTYFEGQAKLGLDLRSAGVEVEIAYAPRQADAARDNFYAGARVDVPLAARFALSARGGYEQSAFFGNKLDWELGATWSRGPFTLGASLIGKDYRAKLQSDPKPALVFSVKGNW